MDTCGHHLHEISDLGMNIGFQMTGESSRAIANCHGRVWEPGEHFTLAYIVERVFEV